MDVIKWSEEECSQEAVMACDVCCQASSEQGAKKMQVMLSSENGWYVRPQTVFKGKIAVSTLTRLWQRQGATIMLDIFVQFKRHQTAAALILSTLAGAKNCCQHPNMCQTCHERSAKRDTKAPRKTPRDRPLGFRLTGGQSCALSILRNDTCDCVPL